VNMLNRKVGGYVEWRVMEDLLNKEVWKIC
jgi:hypothetical protein